jgi:PilZ domain
MKQLNKTGYGRLAGDVVEKRNCSRYPFSPAVEAIDVQGNTQITGRLSDISRNGCFIDTISPFARDVAVTLTITRESEAFKSQAKVVYSKIGMGMGLAFTTAEPKQFLVLGKWLGELSGGKVRERDSPSPNLQLDPVKSADHELRNLVSELIALLNRKTVVNDSEGMALLRKLSK